MNATAAQCTHWRTMRPRREAVLVFVWLWYVECGCWPSHSEARAVFGVWVTPYVQQARAVLTAQARTE